MLALVLLSVSNTQHCWSIMPCCVAKCLDILVVLPPLAHRSLPFVYSGGAAQEESIAKSQRVFVSDSKESFD